MHTSSPDAAPRGATLAALLARTALGDRQAFESLYRAASPQLFGVILRINRDHAQAEDVLQEVFVTVWRSAGDFDARQGQPLTWLTSIARHRAIDSLRRRAAQPETVSRFGALDGGGHGGDGGAAAGDEHDLLDQMPSPAPGPLDLLIDASRTHALEHCMDGLSGEQRSCLALAYYQGLSHTEVAEHLRQPLGTVKSWVRRALQSLRGCLDRAAGRVGRAGSVA